MHRRGQRAVCCVPSLQTIQEPETNFGDSTAADIPGPQGRGTILSLGIIQAHLRQPHTFTQNRSKSEGQLSWLVRWGRSAVADCVHCHRQCCHSVRQCTLHTYPFIGCWAFSRPFRALSFHVPQLCQLLSLTRRLSFSKLSQGHTVKLQNTQRGQLTDCSLNHRGPKDQRTVEEQTSIMTARQRESLVFVFCSEEERGESVHVQYISFFGLTLLCSGTFHCSYVPHSIPRGKLWEASRQKKHIFTFLIGRKQQEKLATAKLNWILVTDWPIPRNGNDLQGG